MGYFFLDFELPRLELLELEELVLGELRLPLPLLLPLRRFFRLFTLSL